MPFVKVASLSQLPPDSLTEIVLGNDLYALCNVAGRITAIGGICPHRGGPLGQGAIHGNHVVCPWHAWEWDCQTGANDSTRIRKCLPSPCSCMATIFCWTCPIVPELPEVETVARSIARLVGRRIVSAEFTCARVLRGNADQASADLAGRRIRGIERRGKFIVIKLDGGYSLVVHLGMTGKLLLAGTPARHTHAIFNLDRGVLRYEDPRQFGKIEVGFGLPARVEELGPEPLEVTLAEFGARLKRRKARIKSVLLDQHFIRGVGNIYADEVALPGGHSPAGDRCAVTA